MKPDPRSKTAANPIRTPDNLTGARCPLGPAERFCWPPGGPPRTAPAASARPAPKFLARRRSERRGGCRQAAAFSIAETGTSVSRVTPQVFKTCPGPAKVANKKVATAPGGELANAGPSHGTPALMQSSHSHK